MMTLCMYLFLLLLCDYLPLISAYFTPVEVTVNDMAVRASRDGLWIGWVASCEGRFKSHQVMVSGATQDAHKYLKRFEMTKDGIHIPSSELVDVKTIKLTLIAIENEEKPVVVNIHLEQDSVEAKPQVQKQCFYLLLVACALSCVLSIVILTGSDVVTGARGVQEWVKRRRYMYGRHAGLVVRLKQNELMCV